MRASHYFLSTLKEAPSEAEVVSHQLMLRAGLIKKLAGGIYSYMPMGLKILRKIESIVREEMNRAGAIELLMPMIQPAELWQETGRFQAYGPELLRLKDRHERDFVLQPTSEEVMTDIARQEINSYKQMPVNFYHIQTKFRDERRPRFGLMRGREFLMKDAYSFDKNEEEAQKSYDRMFDAYHRIFNRLGLNFRAVSADTGSIGGSRSHEFQVMADTGEDEIVYETHSQYAANIELAAAPCLISERKLPQTSCQVVATPGKEKCIDVAAYLKVDLIQTVKSLVLATEEAGKDEKEGKKVQIWLVLLRGDHDLNEVKAGKVAGMSGFRMATEEEIVAHFGCRPGYLGPVFKPELKSVRGHLPVKVVVDQTVANMSDFIAGANQEGFHITGLNWGRDLPEPDAVYDLRNVLDGETSADGKGYLKICRGIEVGHVFFLGTKYSEPMQCRFLDEKGQSQLAVMGCYGIGISRIAAAAIEQNHDDKGMVWPLAISPFEVVVCALGYHKSERVKQQADLLYEQLKQKGMDVVLDDRDIRPGVMFADWELIGVPYRVTLGDRGLEKGMIELTQRRGLQTTEVALPEVLDKITDLVKKG
jgi:prolyl-tRNA synthetase